MVLEELEEVARRVVEGDRRVARPHARHQGLHEVRAEQRRETPALDEGPQGLVLALGGQQPLGHPVEPRHLGQHPQVRGPYEVLPRRKQSGKPEGARVFERCLVAAHRHRHLGVLCLHAELVEQAQQLGVGAQVVHDEAGVDRVLTAGVRDDVGVRVAAQPGVGLVERHVAPATEHVGSEQPRHPAAHDGNPARRAHASSNSKNAMGSVVGASDPPDGSTEIAAAVDSAASPSSICLWSPEPFIRPAGTMSPLESCSHSS